jgi:transcriptional regulator with XRE-family HTH domain
MDDSSLHELSSQLGRNSRCIRELRSLTRQQLGNLCEVPRSTLADVEGGGSNPIPAPRVIKRTAP